jgi:thiosulfate/3-mercaptopyruvate sulfurtransferase
MLCTYTSLQEKLIKIRNDQMTYNTLISLEELSTNLNSSNWVIIDCRFDLADTNKGMEMYLESHIPGAVYAHLNDDLSGPIITGKTSRHPLPDVEAFAATLSNWGIDEAVQVIVYDDRGGAIAGRLWWMLRWLGHDAVAVLDGSFIQWIESGHPTKSGPEANAQRKFKPRVNSEMRVDAEKVMAMRNAVGFLLIDSRSQERFRGMNETLDPVAGHIPGAINAYYGDNLTEDGHFKTKEELRDRFDKILGGLPAENTVFYCGSGVTAAHNILALKHTGLGDALLYPGSWSEWITDPDRPIEV